MSYAGLSQTIDTICLPISQAKKIMIAADQKKILDSLVTLLNYRIVEKESIITDLKQKDTANINIIHTYENQILVMKDQRTVWEDQIKALTKTVKKERRKRRWTSIAGVTLIGIATYLYIVK